MSRIRAIAVIIAAFAAVLFATGAAAPQQVTSAFPQGEAGSGACTQVGSIADYLHPDRATLTGDAIRSCKCAGTPSCASVARDQSLFAAETITTRRGASITFNSAIAGIPSFTCMMRGRATNIVYPKPPVTRGKRLPREQTVLRLVAGAVSCRATDGQWQQAAKSDAVFVAGNTKLVVRGDPVFGITAARRGSDKGSLVQVRKGTVLVGTAAGASVKPVGVKQQVFVANNGSAPSKVRAYKQPDPAIKPALCALTPNLRETNLVKFAGGSPGGHPLGLAEDASGHIWFTDDGINALGKYDLATKKIEYHRDGLNAGSSVKWITADDRGDIWFTDVGTTKAIGRLEPRSGKITEYALDANRRPWAIAYNPVDRRLWFTDQSADGTDPAIGALDPHTIDPATQRPRMSLYRGLNPGSNPEGIAVDAKGDVWFTDDNDPKPAIGTISSKSHVIREFPTGVAGSLPRGITPGQPPDANLYFADERTVLTNGRSRNGARGDGLIGVIHPTGGAPEIAEFSIADNGGNAGSVPEGLAVDNAGHVWFTDDGTIKTIGMIDPVTGAITEASDSSIRLTGKSAPIGILLVTSGRAKGLWFTDQFPNPRIGNVTAAPSC